jgi:hypothetical protein
MLSTAKAGIAVSAEMAEPPADSAQKLMTPRTA